MDYNLYPKRGRLEKGEDRHGRNKKLGNSAKCSQNFSTVSTLAVPARICHCGFGKKTGVRSVEYPAFLAAQFNNKEVLNWLKTLMKPLEYTGILQIKLGIHL